MRRTFEPSQQIQIVRPLLCGRKYSCGLRSVRLSTAQHCGHRILQDRGGSRCLLHCADARRPRQRGRRVSIWGTCPRSGCSASPCVDAGAPRRFCSALNFLKSRYPPPATMVTALAKLRTMATTPPSIARSGADAPVFANSKRTLAHGASVVRSWTAAMYPV